MQTTRRYGRKADLALSTWVKVARAHATLGRLTGEHIRAFELTPAQFGAIETLGHCGPMLIGELTRKQLVCAGNMTVVIDNLAKEGLVERQTDTEDRRAVIVKLTAKGKRLFDRIFPSHAAFVAQLFAHMTEAEQDELSRLLKKLGTGVQAPHGPSNHRPTP
jgi:MarR family transcriptional regulator, 2-MHQ and catechol-resistance regulon repressor